ncbi:MAG TPA: YerC/YecD family TrpR-related protein [Clostridia bacterium]|nr:YerC/YecD family TrpR-related protein [Clostridia bacterium]
MNSKIKSDHVDYLFESILSLKTKEECYNFFEDLCTIAEIKAMSQRLHVARMLREHHVYSDIVGQTGASTATISRVNRCLNYGSDGYNLILDRLKDMGEKDPS